MCKYVFVIIVIPLLVVSCCKRGIQQKVGVARKEKVSTVKRAEEKGYSDITIEEFMQKIEQGKKFVLVDVRAQDEYTQGHIKGAISIPHTEIETRYKEIPKKFT